jgi:predicted transposase YbfD/YdcC
MNHPFERVIADLEDPRIDRCKRHSLEDIIVLTIIAVICGAESWESIADFGESKKEFLKTILELPNGIPSHDTIERLYKRLDSSQFEKCLIAWTNQLRQKKEGQLINMDGKTIRGSRDEGNGKYALHMVSAWCSENELVLGQIKTFAKINEIEAIKQLLDLLDIKGCVISIDAMGCQRDIAAKIVEKSGDYLLAIKDNQLTLKEETEALFNAIAVQSTDKQITKDHGRIEERTCQVIHNLDLLDCKEQWKGLKSIVKINATRTEKEKTTHEIRYYISSQEQTAEYYNAAVRGHWGIENSLHWVLDVQFDEDFSRKRKDNAGENFAIVRRIALNKLKGFKYKRFGVMNKRLKAAWDNEFLLNVLEN